MSTQIVFETHSLTEDNDRGRATGWLDGRLSERGRALARELGERRANDNIAAVFVSDLGRRLRGVIPELLPEAMHVNIGRPRTAAVGIAPHALKDEVAGEGLPGMPQQKLQKLILLQPQVDELAVPPGDT